ncbi:hypothetical protein SAMN05216349_105101 [Oribacterium sp. KHPX15]|uniref:hypothetical protein n=1 Tax=Oribacterium sp. KHPX15 TaxID=1855342 RepID=UPI0008982344|nr:hypothetical protein [Oribacterium sp. KHPX15]SEA13718.1 hypothetical protein SAMN05216349_105101 [Oribacterium sp. KHPX15]
MHHILAFFDEDKTYCDRFRKFASNHQNCPFTVYSFDNYHDLVNFSQDHPIELLVGSEAKRYNSGISGANAYAGSSFSSGSDGPGDSYDRKYSFETGRSMVSEPDLLYQIPAKSIIKLSETPVEAGDADGQRNDPAEKYRIYKYQSGENILREIMTVYGQKKSDSKREYSGRRSKLYLIYSPVGRSGKTRFALALTKVLQKDMKPLYVTLEEVSSQKMPDEDIMCRGTLSEAMYFYKEGKLTGNRLQELIVHDKQMDSILPVRTPEDITTLSPQEIAGFIEHLRTVSGRDAIILDTDSILSRVEGMLPLCDWTFMPVTDDIKANSKITQLENYLSKNLAPEALSHISKIVVPETDQYVSYVDAMENPSDPLLNFAKAVVQNYIYE